MLQAFQVRVPGADFEVEIVLAVALGGGGWSVCWRCVGILLRERWRKQKDQRQAAARKISADIFGCVHPILVTCFRLMKLNPVRYPVLAGKIEGCPVQ